MSSTRRLFGAATLVALGGVISRLLGLVRDPVMALYFGRSTSTDIFVAAQSLSTVVYDLLVSGMVSAALIPTFSRLAARDAESSFWRLVNTVFAAGFVVLVAVVVALEVAAPALVGVMSGGYSPAALDQETVLVRLLAPTVLLLGLSAIATSILYSLQRYLVSALSVAAINCGAIFGILLLHRVGIQSAALGLLMGSGLQLVIQVVALKRSNMPFSLSINLDNPELRHIGRLYLPVAGSVIVTGLVVVVERHLYSTTGSGTLSASYYATRLVQAPLGLVSTALSMAILPTISQYAASKDWSAYRRTIASGLKIAVMLTMPVTALMLSLGRPAIDVIFQHGAFTQGDATATTWAFWLNAPLIPFNAADQLLVTAFYARHDTRTPTAVAVVTAVVWAIAAFTGLRIADWRALVVANTLQNCVHAVILAALLVRREPAILQERVLSSWGRSLAASVVAGAACFVALAMFTVEFGTGRLAQAASLLVVGGCGALLFALVLFVWRGDERRLVQRVFSRQAT